MEVAVIRDNIEKARKYQSHLRSDDYINAQLSSFFLTSVAFQVGPNCNRSCSHCYGSYGPNREGVADSKVVSKALEEIANLSPVFSVVLTDGEPMRYENKEPMGLFAKYSKRMPVRVMTNGVFARTKQNAQGWFEFLKESGFDMNQDGNIFHVSAGLMYKVPFGNYLRINEAIKKVFPKLDVGKHLDYQFLGNLKDVGEGDLFNRLEEAIRFEFGSDGSSTIEIEKDGRKSLRVPNNQGSPVKIHYVPCLPKGRIKNDKRFDKDYPEKHLSVDNIGFNPLDFGSLWISNSGEVGFGFSGACAREGRVYGNILDRSFISILSQIQNDSIYKGYKLGGSRFMYYLGQKVNSDFNVTGRICCDVCHSFFENSELVEKARKLLEKEGLIKTYKEYVETLDFRRSMGV